MHPVRLFFLLLYGERVGIDASLIPLLTLSLENVNSFCLIENGYFFFSLCWNFIFGNGASNWKKRNIPDIQIIYIVYSG
jgi:hypothetical protein